MDIRDRWGTGPPASLSLWPKCPYPARYPGGTLSTPPTPQQGLGHPCCLHLPSGGQQSHNALPLSPPHPHVPFPKGLSQKRSHPSISRRSPKIASRALLGKCHPLTRPHLPTLELFPFSRSRAQQEPPGQAGPATSPLLQEKTEALAGAQLTQVTHAGHSRGVK